MRPMPSVLDAMTPFPYTVDSAESLTTAVNIMYSRNIRHLPVLEGGRLAGILSDRDVKLAMAVGKGVASKSELKVADVCVTDPYVVPHTEKLNVVAQHMAEQHIGSALVTRDNKLVGIFTANDACRKLAELLKIHYPDA
ncbi:MAG: CBS domain-containing protein [Oligoflexia bacterium]|nr:CBS domain-containing protein [Oligoflexia bacterium]